MKVTLKQYIESCKGHPWKRNCPVCDVILYILRHITPDNCPLKEKADELEDRD